MVGPITQWSPGEGRIEPPSKRGLKTREKIVAAALEEFGEVGFLEASIQAIATRAGVASGTAYQYFTDKSDILMFLLADLERTLYRETRMPVDETGRLLARSSVARYLQLYEENRALYRAWWQMLEPGNEFTKVWVALHAHYVDDMKRVFQAARDQGALNPDLDLLVLSELMVALFDRPAFVRIVLGWDQDIPTETFIDFLARLLESRPVAQNGQTQSS